MSEVVCTGLREEHFPLAALAAYGLLRICAEDLDLEDVRLCWRQLPHWTAVLDLPGEGSLANLPMRLAASCAKVPRTADQSRGGSPWRRLPGSFPRNVPLATFAALFREEAMNATTEDRRRTDTLVALGTELIASKKNVVPSPLCMPQSGNSPWATRVCELERVLSDDPQAGARAFEEALFSPWRYRDEQTSLGLDPSAVRLHAYRAQNPTSEGTSPGVRGAVWLAIQSLALFACAPHSRRVATAGFSDRAHDGGNLFLPVWTEAIGLDALRSLLTLPFADDSRTLRDLERRGVAAVYVSRRQAMGEWGVHALGPAEVCAGAGSISDRAERR